MNERNLASATSPSSTPSHLLLRNAATVHVEGTAVQNCTPFTTLRQVKRVHLAHTIKAAFRRTWLIPSVLGVSWRLAASINNPTLLLGE